MKIKTHALILIFVLSLLIITGCNQSQEPLVTEGPDKKSTQAETSSAYPEPESATIEDAYPIPVENNTPPVPYKQGPEFNIDEPVVGGDTVVTGTGPADVPIILVNVSEVGVLMAETVIDESGFFKFELDEPLESEYSIGIQLGDISNTDFNEQDFLFSDTYYDRPYIGILFDIVHIK